MTQTLKQFLYRNPILGAPVFRAVEWYKSHKPGAKALTAFFRQLQAHHVQVTTILDVGANRGEWSRLAMRSFPHAQCFLIEPQYEMQPHLSAFVKDFPASQTLLAGAGAEPGELTLTVWEDRAGSSFSPDRNDPATQGLERRVVPIVTVDNLIHEKKLAVPDLVKIDVQGFEKEVLKGMPSCFGRTHAFIIEVGLMEFFPKAPIIHDIIGMMAENGYVLYDITDSLRRPYDNALAQCDCVFVLQHSPLRAVKTWA